jgi:hypothetical protein
MILEAMATAVFSIAVTQFTKRIPFKPFNCEMCMTFWLSLIVSLLTYSYTIEVVTFVGIAVFTRQLLWKLWATMF